MKTLYLLSVLTLVTFTGHGQNNYEQAMKNGLDSMKNMKSSDDFQTLANYFDRIANVEKSQWLPAYYGAYCYIILSFREQDKNKKQLHLDKAKKLIETAVGIGPDESEVYALQGMLYQAYIMLDPQSNGRIYSGMAINSFNKAIELDPGNPRPYYLKGTNLIYTPEAYGGGLKNACPLLNKAAELYEKFEKKNELMPDWGRENNQQTLNKCEAPEKQQDEGLEK